MIVTIAHGWGILRTYMTVRIDLMVGGFQNIHDSKNSPWFGGFQNIHDSKNSPWLGDSRTYMIVRIEHT